MNLKKYLKPFWHHAKTAEQVTRHRRKFGFLHWGTGIQKIGLLHYLIPALVTVSIVGAVATQVPNSLFAAFNFTKPKPIIQSSTYLSADIQSAIQNLAKADLKTKAADANLAVNNDFIQTSQTGVIQPLVDTVQSLFTTDPVDKAKLELRIIDRQINELGLLLENDKSDKAVERAVNLIKTIGQETGQVVSDPKAQADEQSSLADKQILTTLIEQYNRLQLVIQKVEDQLPVASYLKIDSAREIYLEKGAKDSLNNAPNLEAVNNIGIKEVAKIVGSDVAELKAIEILTDLEEGLKPETKVKLSGIQKQLAIQFEKKMLKLPRDVRERKLQNYINYSYGNPLRQAEAFEVMKHFLSDREMILAVDSLKELSLHKLEDRVFEIKDQETLNQFLDTNFQTPSDLKVLVQLKLDVLAGKDTGRKARITQLEQNSKGKVIEKFGKVENLTAFLNQDASSSADLLDIVAITQLSTSLDSPQVGADAKNTIKTIKQKVLQNFVTNIAKKDFITQVKSGYNPVSQNSDVRLLLVDPQVIPLLEEIKKDLPATDQGKIAIAEKAAIGLLANHVLLHINDPDVFKEHEQSINDNPQVKQLILSQFGQSFFTNLNQKGQVLDKQSKEDEQKLYEKMQQLVQQIFLANDGKLAGAEKQLPTEIQAEINKLKAQLPDNNVPKLDTPEGVTLPEVAKLPTEVEKAIVAAAQSQIDQKNISVEAKLDLSVQAKDLRISEPSILPGNLLYPIVELVRNITLVVTIDPVARAEALLKQDNEKTLEAAKLVEESSSQETINLALTTLNSVAQDFDKLKEHTQDLIALKQSQPEKVDQLVEHIIENGLARQTVLASIEAKVNGDEYVKIEEIRSGLLENGVGTLLQLTDNNVALLTNKLETAVEQTSGSDLKDIKAVEVLVEIAKTQLEPSQQIIEKAEEQIIQSLETKLLEMPTEQRVEKVLDYVSSEPGNPVIQFEAADVLKDNFTHPETIALAEGIKDQALENLIQIVSEIPDGASKKQFVDQIVGDKPQDLAAIIDMETRVSPPAGAISSETLPIVAEIEDIKATVEQNIIEAAKDNPEILVPIPDKAVDVIEVKAATEVTDALERSPDVLPTVIKAAQDLEQKTINQFVEEVSSSQFQASTNVEAAQVLTPVPEVIAELIALKNDVPTSVDVKIDAAIVVQVDLMQEHLATQVNDPQTFEIYVAQIKQDPLVAKIVAQVGGSDFTAAIEKKTEELKATANSNQITLVETVKQIEQEIFSNSGTSQVEQTLLQTVQDQIQQIKQDVPVEQIPSVTVSATVTVTPQPTNAPIATPEPISTTAPASIPTTAPAPAAPEVQQPAKTEPAPAAPAVPGL